MIYGMFVAAVLTVRSLQVPNPRERRKLVATVLRPGDELMEIIEMFMEDGHSRTLDEVYDLLTDNGIVINDVDPKGAVGLELALSTLIECAPGGSPSDDYVYTLRQLVRS